jgi:hypothetical protein
MYSRIVEDRLCDFLAPRRYLMLFFFGFKPRVAGAGCGEVMSNRRNPIYVIMFQVLLSSCFFKESIHFFLFPI